MNRWLNFLVVLVVVAGTAASIGHAAVGPGYDIEMSRLIPVRDGVELEAWIWKPTGLKNPVPTVLTLTQYDIDGAGRGVPQKFTKRGYAFVQVYVRGRGASGGAKSDNLGLQTGRDGYDVVEWIARQPWSDGNVVMYGGSFVGMSQWRTAVQRPPHLASVAPYVPIYPGYDVPNTNGIPQSWTNVILGFVAGRSLNTGFIGDQPYWAGKMLEHYAAHRPFHELDDMIGVSADDWWVADDQGRRSSFFDVWLDHLGDAAFNLAAAPSSDDYADMEIPILSVTGHFDDDQPGTLHYYRGHTNHAAAEVAAKHFLVIGPWDHGGTQQPRPEIGGLEISEAAIFDMVEFQADWHDWILERGPKPEFFKDRVAFFMMGADEWRYAPSLDEVESGEALTLYLSEPEGTPGDVFHSGTLAFERPDNEPPAIIISDPRELPELEVAELARDEDFTSQFRGYQERSLNFHSAPFDTDVEIAGHMNLALMTQADTPDFDLWAEVLMVNPDGSAVQLGEDIRRARFRNGTEREELLEPGQMAEITFEFYWTARRIPAGARLRVTVAPLNSPYYQKNYNSGGRMGYEGLEDAKTATIQVFHDESRPSRLILPLAAER